MNKKIFGIKLGTILTVFVCVLVAVAVWMLVKYHTDSSAVASAAQQLSVFRG